MKIRLMAAVSAAALSAATMAQAQGGELTLCWAAWDPANALVELSKDFEAQSGIKMNFEFVPWPNFADRMLNELNSGGQLCDLLIGDSQWIGGAAENGWYVKMNDFFDAEGISMDDFAPATVYAYSTWPKGTPNYYALPAMGDANGWFYRKDWFARPEIQAEFKEKYGRDLAEPQTQKELLEIAQFFQGREIDGKTVYGASIFTERGSEGITMGATGALYAWGFKYENTPGSYDMQGAVNSPEAVEALEFYKELYKTGTPPGYDNAYMEQSLDAFKSGQVAMAMNWFAFFPGLYADPNTGGDKIDFFVNPAQNVAASTLGGQGISVVANTDNMDGALAYVKWFANPDVQKKWWSMGGYSCHKAVLEDPNFVNTAPFAGDFLQAMGGVQDFWQEPAYAQLLLAMQERLHNFVVADQGTAQEALDGLIADWTEVFEDEGKL
ncbi:MAG: extracellular solute-binding protein [Rhodobacteraceae bacterium]|jgi:multiple sugar transport system substrate-binding protein|uniref:ABC transporter substrate-binding protein n=1 Tax=Tabrizicola sp. TH137 TaxID=2067452 RepID=UPI000C7AEFD9|nr:extracellular solute-binding protein [Tabrizicola sp. TH137]MBD1204981.1 extracellular solute-binding protein [Paracoccaceae bacterium]MCZ8153866.1 extracellular solute-binding protein [Paracoccaceae bacterium]PLL13627.1 ABC transporter substrate-binding protein [Tabrizicola sp. TH137]